MARRPSFQFYPGDWRKDPNLRRCSPTARGVFMDMLCPMFESEKCGVLETNRVPWTVPEIARECSCKRKFIDELLANGVVVKDPKTGAICSKRMMRDEAGRESARARSRRTSAEPAQKRRITVPSSSSSSVEREETPPTPSSESKPRKQFVTPTVDQVRAYCLERRNHVDPEKFVDHYESTGWMVGKVRMKNWKASVRTWEKSNVGTGIGTRTSRVEAEPGKYAGRPGSEFPAPGKA